MGDILLGETGYSDKSKVGWKHICDNFTRNIAIEKDISMFDRELEE